MNLDEQKYLERTETADILRRARALIVTEDRWCQFVQEDAAGRMCAVGAIVAAVGRIPYADHRRNGVYDGVGPWSASATQALSAALPRSACSIAEFNNHSTHAEVLAAFERAIALAEESITLASQAAS